MAEWQLIPVGDGLLEVEVIGGGEPVVVIQTALDADELAPLSRSLADSVGLQVVHQHRRGYAGCSPARRVASIAAEAADTAALIRSLDLAPAHVVGVSYSAAIALTLASSEPGTVQTLTVVEPPPVGTAGAAAFRAANQGLRRSHADRGAGQALEEFMTMLVGPDWRAVSEGDRPGSVAAMESGAATFFTSDIPALLAWTFGPAEAARIDCPVLHVGGGESRDWFTQMRDRLLRLLPNARGATLAGAGHLLASTHPAPLSHLVREHVLAHQRS